jgi:hypothetical protein
LELHVESWRLVWFDSQGVEFEGWKWFEELLSCRESELSSWFKTNVVIFDEEEK